MLKSLGIKNLRSFTNKTMVELKPITVFVGKNSSGKSSFLRTFPLLRQSVEANTTGPILWFGRLVDFGDFSEAVSNINPNNTIDFHFELDTEIRRSGTVRLKDQDKVNISLELKVETSKQKTIMHSAELSINGVAVEIISKGTNADLYIKYKNITISKDELIFTRMDQFIPSLAIPKKKDDARNAWLMDAYEFFYHDELEKSFLEQAVDIAKKYFNSRTDLSNIKKNLSRISLVSKNDFNIILTHLFKEQKLFIRHLKNNKDEIIDSLYPYLVAWNLIDTIKATNSELSRIFTGVKYIAPLRATTERYYRFQDLQVDEIDHTGSNLAMLLNSLKPIEQKEFSNWTRENFGFSVIVKSEGAHYAVKITTENDPKEYNISDMGFGYSQVLPIIASIWIETEKRKNKASPQTIFVIEQPELHLHPAYQAKIGDLFAKVISVAKQNNITLNIIFETHSQSIIEALGEKVENKMLDKNDISVIIFEKNQYGNTDIDIANFDNEGYLINWPIGFLSGR